MKDCTFSLASARRAVLLTIFLAAATLVSSATDKILYSFKGGDDGANPEAPLIADTQGNLYGTTAGGGGSCDCGTVFMLSLQNGAWVETILYRFNGGDGASPQAALTFDAAGNLYGTTASGGPTHDGTVFMLSPTSPGQPWTETVLYNFTGRQDGEYPVAGVAFDTSGNLYGTTLFGGGSPNAGVVFQVAPPQAPGGQWTETVTHRFGHGQDGANPMAGVLVDRNGALYGTTMATYQSGAGLVYKLTAPGSGQQKWTERGLYKFNGRGDGSEPSDIIAFTGNGYGVATLGGSANHGTVYQLTPQAGLWMETTLYEFQGGTDGGLPIGALVADRSGNLYGATYAGQEPDNGTIFQLSPSQSGKWTKTTLHEFDDNGDGRTPNGGLVFGKGGALYGTTYTGGDSGNGAVFAVKP